MSKDQPADDAMPPRAAPPRHGAATRFARAGDILADCLGHAPAERAAFVARAAAGDQELEALVTEMLRAAELSGTFLDGGIPAEQAREVAAALTAAGDREADRVAGYEIIEALGAGGFGVVWLARQLEPVQRDVALKVLKPGMDTRDIVARFEHERQALARMSHENIARVLDAGVTDSGRPFFAMELVRGQPITRHCDEQRLGLRARLRLFVEACSGVQHAHQRGIIHRDIKPSNVLVTSEGGRPIPKVIDFGIAKAIAGDAEERLVRTQRDEVLGTPAYMSPEQATPGAVADTRTDVYSLGVLLYELLTGMLPFDQDAMRRASSQGLTVPGRVEPPRPSDRLRTQQRLQDIASARGIEPLALRRELRGDLDWIVMTAMANEPERRYPTVAALVADIERHLADIPVEARPPSAVYRLRKLARRHRFGVAAAAVALTLLIAGLLGTAHGLAEANQARRVAEERSARAEEQAYRGSMLLAEQAIRARRLEAARALLDDAPKDLRGWEWSLLAGRLDPDVVELIAPGPTIDVVLAARDGSRCWTWDRARLDAWDASGRRIGAGLEIPGFVAGYLWEEENGSLVGLRSTGELFRVTHEGSSRELVDLPPIEPLKGGGYHCYDASSRSLFWSARGILHVRQSDGGPIREGPRVPGGRSQFITCTRDGAWLIAAGSHELHVIDTRSLERVHAASWPAHKELARMALSPDDSLLGMGYSDGSVELHEFRPGALTLRHALASDPAWVTELAFSRDGKWFAASHGGGTVRTWDVASGELRDSLALAGDPAGRIAFLGSRLLVAPWNGGVLSWRPGADEHRRLRAHASYVYAIAVTDGGTLAVSGGWDPVSGESGGLKWWDVPSRRLVASWGDDRELVHAMARSPDGTRIWAALGWHPDSRVVAIDARTGEVAATFEFPDRDAVHVAAFDARTAVVIVGGDDASEALVLDGETGTTRSLPEIEFTPGAAESSRAVSVSADGRWLALSWRRGGLQVLDARTFERLARRDAHDASTWSLAFSPDGERLASASDDGTVGIWAIPSLVPLHRLRGSGSPVMCAAWSPDATRLAAGTRDGSIELWDPARALLVGRLTGHASYVKSLAWTPDGRALLSASGDHDIRVWDNTSAEEIADAATERESLLAGLEPVIAEQLAKSGDAKAVAGWIDSNADLTPRERQVARQVLLRRGLEAPTVR